MSLTAANAIHFCAALGRMPLALALAGWLIGAVSVMAWLAAQPAPAGTRYDTMRSRFTLPGSALPLALMMIIFSIKYGVAVAFAMHPTLRTTCSLHTRHACYTAPTAARSQGERCDCGG